MKYTFYLQNGTAVDSLPEGYTGFYIAEDIESDSELSRYFYPGDKIQYSLDSLCVDLYDIFQYAVFPSRDDFYKNYEMEGEVMEEVKDHLIVTIVNQGYAEKVMTEAKKAGAGGGTTINGRGLETDKVIKFLNIAIEPEKDIVLNLVASDKKNDIMKAIVDNCGLKTPGAGICFSLPVDMVAGISKH